MLTFLFSFFEEFLLINYLLIGLLCCSFQKTLTRLTAKKTYVLFFQFTICILLLITLFNVYMLINFNQSPLSCVSDSLGITEFYQITITDNYGNCYFRKDFVIQFFTVILNFLSLFYLYLFYVYQKITTITTKYFLEIPLFFVATFLALKFFLLAYDFLLIVLALELTAFCSVILMSLQITTNFSVVFPFEAAIKYFIFNAISISLLLFAISGYYSLFKTFNLFTYTFYYLFEPAFCYEYLETLLFFHCFFFVAYLIKIGAVPFHQWVPDVYEGAELLMTAFLVLIVGPILNLKFFVFLKTLLPLFEINGLIFGCLFLSGILSVIVGSLNAFSQFRIKRFLAYTGMTHLGYILISFGTATFFGFFASFFYLLFYIITNCIFFTLLILTPRISNSKINFFNQLKTLFSDNMLLIFLFLIPLFSFAGFPPFAGFFSKFFVLFTLIDLNKILLTLSLVFYILLSAYLYLRFIKVSLFENHRYHIFLPVQFKKTLDAYYWIQNLYRSGKKLWQINNLLLLIIFILTLLLLLLLLILPIVSLSFQKPLFTLFLFF